jgi:predicted nuclease with TOPRIM domain
MLHSELSESKKTIETLKIKSDMSQINKEEIMKGNIKQENDLNEMKIQLKTITQENSELQIKYTMLEQKVKEQENIIQLN